MDLSHYPFDSFELIAILEVSSYERVHTVANFSAARGSCSVPSALPWVAPCGLGGRG